MLFKKECVHSMIKFPLQGLMKPSSFAKKSSCLLVHSLLWSLRMYLLPLNVEYTPVRYALMTSLVLFDLMGIINM